MLDEARLSQSVQLADKLQLVATTHGTELKDSSVAHAQFRCDLCAAWRSFVNEPAVVDVPVVARRAVAQRVLQFCDSTTMADKLPACVATDTIEVSVKTRLAWTHYKHVRRPSMLA